MLDLTREQTIIEHRKMWNWLADQYEAGRFVGKEHYIVMKYGGNKAIVSNCFCCDFGSSNSNSRYPRHRYYCDLCPIEWGDDNDMSHCMDENSPYFYWCALMKRVTMWLRRFPEDSDISPDIFENLSRYAREIANLPEKRKEEKT